MTIWKALPVAGAWLAFAATVGFGALTATAQQPADPAAAPAAVEAAPAAAEAPAAVEAVAPAEAAAATLTAKDLPIGAAVFGNDGAQIGEINRVTSEPSGAVKEIHVTTGGKAGLDAQAVIVPADKITGAGDGVKLSLSAAEVKNLPVADNGAG